MIFKLHHMIGGANDQAEVKGTRLGARGPASVL